MDLVDRLYRKIKEDPLSPKVLVTSSYAQGHQLLEQVSGRYGSIFNVEVQTLQGLVRGNTKLILARRRLRFIDEEQLFWVVHQIMMQVAEAEPQCYIDKKSMLNPGIVNKIHQTLVELRMAGVRSEEVREECFTNKQKGAYLQQLLARYEAYLRENALTDAAGLEEFCVPTGEETLFILLQPADWSKIEWRLIEKIAGKRLCVIDFDTPFYDNEQFSNNSFTMFRATGSLAEVREGLRRMLADPEPLDHTEIILSDYERYVPVIFSQVEALGVECTFSNGLPMTFCTMGKALLAILDWIEAGYPVTKLTEMLRHGCLRIPDMQAAAGDWIRLLERSGIGWGRKRYTAILRSENGDEEQELKKKLYDHIQSWFDRLPEGDGWTPNMLLAWLLDFAQKYVPVHSVDDCTVKSALQDWNQRISAISTEPMSPEWAVRYMKEILNHIRIRVDATPKPGAIHVASIHNGCFSGRCRTWIVGMDEHAWSIPAMQDPLLLDEERTAVSNDLQLVREKTKKIRSDRDTRLSLVRGEVWLSYASYDPAEKDNSNPAFEMLQMLRLQSGDDTQDFNTLATFLGPPCSFMDLMHQGERGPNDELEAWAQYLRNLKEAGIDGGHALAEAYPNLAQGHRASLHRHGEELSNYDGWLNIDVSTTSGTEEVPGQRVISVSQLEKYAACGLQYYFYSILKLRPKEIPTFDRSRWLQADERGTLLHDVFRKYLEEVTESGTKPPQHDRSKLQMIIDQAIANAAQSIPAPSQHVFKKECEEIRRDADIFYRNEARKTDQPCFFELELAGSDGEPMELALPGGIRIKLKGFVDRVDRIGPNQYRIIDYKTGSPKKYASSGYFSGGTQLQHALYAIAVEQWLRETGRDTDARVTEAEYAFPTERGRGEHVRRIQNRREELAGILARLVESMNRGLFIPAKDSRTCTWCDYKAVCGSHAEWSASKRGAVANADTLGTLLEVEGID